MLTFQTAAGPITSIFVYDTLIILAISYRLAADAVTGASWHSRLLSIIQGKGLYSLSKLLMRSGQLYYMYVIYEDFKIQQSDLSLI